MIKIQSSSYPIVWQIDNSYLLPAQSGQVRWNGNIKQFEVCDNLNNGVWYKIDNTIQLSCDPQLQTIIEWAKKKMAEDEKIAKLAEKYVAVRDAKEKLEIVIKLVQDEDSSTKV